MVQREEKRPLRWSAKRKADVVLRYFRGEGLDNISRDIGVPISEIERWCLRGLRGITEALKQREGDPLLGELEAAQKHIGELSMENELLKKKASKVVFLEGRW